MGWEGNAGGKREENEDTKWTMGMEEWRRGSCFNLKERDAGRLKNIILGQTTA
jgi:hypothetical protein